MPASFGRWELPRTSTLLQRRSVQISIALFSILILLISGLPQPKASANGSRFQTDTGSGGTGNATFYPYIANTSNFPLPDNLQGNATTGFYPHVASTVINGVPTFLLVAVVPGQICVPNGNLCMEENGDLFQVFEGTYSASLAFAILNKSTSDHLPIQWGSPVTLGGVVTGLSQQFNLPAPPPPISATAVATSTDGNELYAAMSLTNGTTYVYESISQGAWTMLTSVHGLTGTNVQIAFGGFALLVTTRTTSTIYTETYYLSGISPTDNSLSVSNLNDAVAWFPSAGMGEECILVATAADTLVMYGSYDGGHTFTSGLAGNFSVGSSNGTVFNSIGGTVLAAAVGYPGEVQLTVEGSTLFALYTTELANQVVAATTVSANGGAAWSPPDFTVLTNTSVVNPSITSSAAGYIYATWLENARGAWTVDAVEYSEDGRIISGPGALPGATPGGPTPNATTSVAVDSFDRPLYVWSIPAPNGNSCSSCTWLSAPAVQKAQTIEYDGAFLSPANALAVVQQHLNQLSAWDFKLGRSWTLGSTLTTSIGVISRSIANFTSTKASSWYCTAQNTTGSTLYTNLTHYLFGYTAGPTVCGSFSHVIADTTGGDSNGVATAPPNYGWAQPIGWTMGPQTANTYLGTLMDWALESMAIPVPYSDDPLRGFNPVTDVIPQLALPVAASTVASNSTESISVLATALNPTTAIATPTANLPEIHSGNWTNLQNCQGQRLPWTWQVRGDPSTYSQSVSVENNSGRVISTSFQGAYLTNLTPNATIHWNGTYTVHYAGTLWAQECGGATWTYQGTYGLPSHSVPSSLTFNLAGTVTTTMRMVPEAPIITATGSGSTLSLRYYWNNTMPGKASGSLAYNGANPTWHNNTAYVVPDALGTFTATVGDGYLASMTATSRSSSGWNNTQRPPISANEAFSSPAMFTAYNCYFDLGHNPVTMTGFRVTNLTNGPGGSATVSWNSSVLGTGYVTYYELGVATNLTQSTVVTGSGSSYHYFAQLHALPPSSLYYVNGVTSLGNGCLTFQANANTTFNTLGKFFAHETDLPYDSIGGVGGGAMVTWQLPANISKYSISNGSVDLVNNTANSASTVYQISNISQIEPSRGQFRFNLTPTSLNMSYTCTIFLNFTFTPSGGHALYWNITSWPLVFVYERDTSGDGLTDVEKLRGWMVQTTQSTGGESWGAETWATANPRLQDTNGLVSDFIEKEYGLSPVTVDTAGSHMLDTWNLTFNLGSMNHSYSLPPPLANLRYWGENGSYNPFSVPQYPGGSRLNGPLSTTMTNATQDNSPWAAEVLWPYSDLQKFVNYSGVQNASWLRGVFGNWSGDRTLTIWGKLSWGANPLVESTPNDGIPDGYRVNPVNDEAIQFYFGGFPNGVQSGGFYLNPNATSNGCGNVPNNAGIALRFSTSASSGGFAGQNYSSQFLANCGNGASGGWSSYALSIPVANQSIPTQIVRLQMWANISTNSAPDPVELPINGCHWTYNVSVDMLNATQFTVNGAASKFLWANGHGGCGSGVARTETAFGYSEVPLAVKTPTYLWLPDQNQTLNSLPWGLKRYTGEESFVLVVVNNKDSTSDTSASIPLPWGGTANGVTVNPGLNNILIPRTQFFASPLGEALLENRTIPNGTSNGGSLLSSTNGGVLLNGGSQATLSQLACFWQARAVNLTAKAYLCGTSTFGTNRTSSYAVKIASALNCTSGNCGGVPSNALLENSSVEGAALTNLITLNLSAPVATTQEVLDTILAGLLMNSTGGVNGTLLGVTNQLSELGLDPVILNALANVTYNNGGLYGLPVSRATPPTPSCSSFNLGSICFNAAVGTIILLGLVVGIALITAIAIASYFALGPNWINRLGGAIDTATASALAAIGAWMDRALALLMSFIIHEVQQLLSFATQPIIQAIAGFDNCLGSASNASLADVVGGGSVTEAHGLSWIHCLDGIAILGTLLASSIIIALSLLAEVDLGATFIQPLILGLFIEFATAAFPPGLPSVTAFSSQAVLNLGTFFESISTNVWKEVAGVVAIGASSSDFVATQILLVIKGAVSGLSALSLMTSIIIDLIVIAISIENWAASWPPLAATAVFLAALGLGVSSASLHFRLAGLETYAEVSFGLSVVGLGAVIADVAL